VDKKQGRNQSKLNNVIAKRVANEFGERAEAKLKHHSGSVGFHCSNTDIQDGRHFSVELSHRQVVQHLTLPITQPVNTQFAHLKMRAERR
jgi:hypothetical protein